MRKSYFMTLTELNNKVSLKVLFQGPSPRIQVLGKGVDRKIFANTKNLQYKGSGLKNKNNLREWHILKCPAGW